MSDESQPGFQSPRVVSQTTEDIGPKREALRHIASINRDLIEALIGSDLEADELESIAAGLDELRRRFGSNRPRSGYEGMAEIALSGGDLGVFFDRSPMIGLANPLAPPVRISQHGREVSASVYFGSAYEGPPGCVHGGYIAAAFDEVLGAAQTASGAPGMTASLKVDYRKPTPLHKELTIIGSFDRVEGRKVFTTGQVIADGVVTAEAEALFISLGRDQFTKLAEDFDRRLHDNF